MKITTILFDMDGVLIEAKDWHYKALNRALDLFGMPISRFDHLTSFDGLPTRRKLEILSVEQGLPFELHGFINEMKQVYTMEFVHSLCKPCFTHEYALSQLKARHFRIGVCSNSMRNTVETMMEKSNLIGHLDYIVSNEDVKAAKPDPEMYLKAMDYFCAQAQETLILEDNPNGIKAAQASGAHVLVVRDVMEANLDNILAAISKLETANSPGN